MWIWNVSITFSGWAGWLDFCTGWLGPVPHCRLCWPLLVPHRPESGRMEPVQQTGWVRGKASRRGGNRDLPYHALVANCGRLPKETNADRRGEGCDVQGRKYLEDRNSLGSIRRAGLWTLKMAPKHSNLLHAGTVYYFCTHVNRGSEV